MGKHLVIDNYASQIYFNKKPVRMQIDLGKHKAFK